MSDSAPRLRLTDTAAPWHDRRFRWDLRKSGILARLKPAETKLLLWAYALSDDAGECDLPVDHTAAELGYTPRAVAKAIDGLEAHRLLIWIGHSPDPRFPRVKRYRLLAPEVPPEREPPGAPPRANACSKPERVFTDTGTHVPPEGEHTFGQRGKEKENSSSAPGPTPPPDGADPGAAGERGGSGGHGGGGGRGGGGGGLFDEPGYDAAAAAALKRAGFGPRVAHGLISQHRPTLQHVRNIIANAAAMRREGKLRHFQGFVRSAIASGNWSLDDRVLSIRQRAHERARRARRRRQRQHGAAGGGGGESGGADPAEVAPRAYAAHLAALGPDKAERAERATVAEMRRRFGWSAEQTRAAIHGKGEA